MTVDHELPQYCYSIDRGVLVLIQCGVSEMSVLAESTDDPALNARLASMLNEGAGVTPPQRAAMESGAVFGWDNPMASPAKYDEEGHSYDTCMGYAVKGWTRIKDIGIVFAENPQAVQPYVTWQVNEFGHFRDYYWGHYFREKQDAMQDYRVRIRQAQIDLARRQKTCKPRSPER